MRTSKTPAKPAAPEPMKRANFFVPPATLRALSRMAEKKGCNQADIVRAALTQYLHNHKASVSGR